MLRVACDGPACEERAFDEQDAGEERAFDERGACEEQAFDERIVICAVCQSFVQKCMCPSPTFILAPNVGILVHRLVHLLPRDDHSVPLNTH